MPDGLSKLLQGQGNLGSMYGVGPLSQALSQAMGMGLATYGQEKGRLYEEEKLQEERRYKLESELAKALMKKDKPLKSDILGSPTGGYYEAKRDPETGHVMEWNTLMDPIPEDPEEKIDPAVRQRIQDAQKWAMEQAGKKLPQGSYEEIVFDPKTGLKIYKGVSPDMWDKAWTAVMRENPATAFLIKYADEIWYMSGWEVDKLMRDLGVFEKIPTEFPKKVKGITKWGGIKSFARPQQAPTEAPNPAGI